MLNIALIGIGNIGLLFDKDINDKSKALSHIKAIYLHKKLNLKYAVDIDNTHKIIVQKFFPNVIFLNTYEILINNTDIDILTIATPTSTHHKILKQFSKNKYIKQYFIEKPLFNTNKDYKNLLPTINNKIVINYLRRFDKNIQKLKKEILQNKFGDVQKIVINYCKGIKNNGSHMIDMINFLFNNPKIVSSKILDTTKGFNKDDLTYDIFIKIKYQNQIIPIYFLGLDHTLYNVIEQNIYFENKIVRYINSKSQIEYFNIVSDKIFPQYKVSSKKAKIKKVSTKLLMLNAYKKIYKIIEKKEKNISSYKDELANIKFLNLILKGHNEISD